VFPHDQDHYRLAANDTLAHGGRQLTKTRGLRIFCGLLALPAILAHRYGALYRIELPERSGAAGADACGKLAQPP